MRVAIIGAGLTGLALAERLSDLGCRVAVYEASPQLGGLTTHHDYGSFVWDRFYHVILPSDRFLIGFLKRIGLGERLRWRQTRTGFYVDGRYHSMDDNVDFLKFPPLSLVSKMRLAFTILYCSRIDDWERLEQITVEDWLIKHCGRKTYEKLWKPLLLAKLGEEYRRVSAVFIWSYVKRMFSARDASASKEQLGYVSGSYKAVFDRLVELIERRGGRISPRTQVSRIDADGEGLRVSSDVGEETYDRVVFTGPTNVLRQVADPGLVEVGERGDVEYLGVVCGVLVTSKPVTPYYILNIADDECPFTGVIGMSTLVDTSETAGRHITYLPKYVLSTDPLLDESDDVLRESFMRGMERLFPDFRRADVEQLAINRARKVQPLQVLNFSKRVPTVETRHPAFFVLNTAQFVNNTLNNNEVIRRVEEFMERYGDRFASESRQAAYG